MQNLQIRHSNKTNQIGEKWQNMIDNKISLKYALLNNLNMI